MRFLRREIDIKKPVSNLPRDCRRDVAFRPSGLRPIRPAKRKRPVYYAFLQRDQHGICNIRNIKLDQLNWTAGVNFTNVLQAALSSADPRMENDTDNLIVF